MPIDLKNYFKFSPYYANNENLSDKELEELDTKADKVPMEVKNHLVDPDISDVIRNLIKIHGLTEKQAVIVAVLVRRIFLKDSSRNTLSADLIKYANMDTTKAQQVTKYLEEKIFMTVPAPIQPAPTQTIPEQREDNVINLKQK